MYTSLLGEIIAKNEERGARSSHVRVSVTSGIAHSFVILGSDIHINFVCENSNFIDPLCHSNKIFSLMQLT